LFVNGNSSLELREKIVRAKIALYQDPRFYKPLLIHF